MGVKDENKEYPKLLIIAHNPFSQTSNNGKTRTLVFDGWPKDRIAQLFFRNERPDFTVCHNFFRITDESLLHRRKPEIGNKIDENKSSNCPVDLERKAVSIQSFLKTRSIVAFFRNCLWAFDKWNNDRFNKWVLSFAPEVIFLSGGPFIQGYRIAYTISSRLRIPIFPFFGDDYLTTNFSLDAFKWLNYLWLRKSLNRVLKNTPSVLVIGEDMNKHYTKLLRVNCTTVMTPTRRLKYSDYSGDEQRRNDNELHLAYFGGLHLNRWKSLRDLGKAIIAVNEKSKVNITLSIYSNKTPDEKILRRLVHKPYTRFVGSVNERQIAEEMSKYDVLVHAESFDHDARRKTKFSISTKIPEYLETGKPILAIGPKEIASIRYLTQYETAYVIDTSDQIKVEEIVWKVYNDRHRYGEICSRNRELAKMNHSPEIIHELVRRTLLEHSNNI